MNRTLKTTGVAVLATALTLTAAACSDDDGGSGEQEAMTNLEMGTGSTGGTYYPLGGEMATVMSEHVEGIDGFNVTSVETGASVENLVKIANGELQLGMSINGTVMEAIEGIESFEDAAVENVGFITQIYPEVLHVITTEGTGVDSVDDLAGKRVAIGPPGGGSNILAQQVLAAYGIEEGDYEAFAEDFGTATERMQNGQVDAIFGILGAPASAVDQVQTTSGDVKYLEITGEPLEALLDETLYEAFTMPADTYTWLDSDVNTLSARAVLVASTTQVDEETGYQITKALIENGDQITHDQGQYLTEENALEGALDIPLHPGAQKYYDEIGVGR